MIQLEEKLVTYVWPRDLVVISLSLHAHLPGINGMAYSYLPSFQLLYAALVEVVASHDYRPPATLKLVRHGPDRTRQLDLIYCILFGGCLETAAGKTTVVFLQFVHLFYKRSPWPC